MTCEEATLKAQALLDGEIAEAEMPQLLTHLAGCESCREEYIQLMKLEKRFKDLPYAEGEAEWFETLSRRPLRRTGSVAGKIFFFGSYLLLLGYALMSLLKDPGESLVLKLGVGGIVLGFLILLAVTIADRITESKHDRYKGVMK
jgi:anti-sigma factor RsiW